MDPIVRNGNKLRWKFENVKNLISGEMGSDKLTIDPIDWKIKICTKTVGQNKFLVIRLVYDSDNQVNKNWICEVEAIFKLLKQIGDKKHIEKEFLGSRCYHQGCTSWGFSNYIPWSSFVEADGGYLKDDSIEIEVDFNFRYYDFSKQIPNVTDIIVNVEDTEFHLNKWALGSRSKYFYDLILNTNPNELRSIRLDDDRAENFCYMLASFYPFFDDVIDDNFYGLIDLAKKYGVPSLHQKCEQYLIGEKKLELIDKIKYADENDYEKLMKTCIKSLATGLDIKELRNDAKFSELKDSTKLRIMDRFLDFC